MSPVSKPTIPPRSKFSKYSGSKSREVAKNSILLGAVIVGVIVVILVIGTMLKKANYYMFYESEVKQTIQELVKSSSLK